MLYALCPLSSGVRAGDEDADVSPSKYFLDKFGQNLGQFGENLDKLR